MVGINSRDEISLIKGFSDAIASGNGALFVGSGISSGLGKASWKTLLLETCSGLGIDIENTKIPYPEIAQFWVDEQDTNRRILTDRIEEILAGRICEVKYQETIYNQICHLNIRDIWTTNYDHIIEDAYSKITNKRVKVIDEDNKILSLSGKEDVRIYKMHGSLSNPNKMVITAEDYFSYKRKWPFFSDSLFAGLLQKTFLFVGFSFDDPNIQNILRTLKDNLDHIRQHHNESLRQHYLILYSDACTDEEIRIERFKIKSLSKLGIKTIKVHRDKDEVSNVFLKLRKYTNRKNIVVAGSCRGSSTWNSLPEFSAVIGKGIIKNKRKYNIHACYGEGVGKDSIQGALEECSGSQVHNANNRICVWPTYEKKGISDSDKNKIDEARASMVKNAAICIFMGGEWGTYEEFVLARKYKKFCIPIGITGGVTKEKILLEYYDYVDEMCESNNVCGEGRAILLLKIKEMGASENFGDVKESLFDLIDYYHDHQFGES